MDETRFTIEQIESMKTHEVADLLSNLVLVLRRLPDVPVSQLEQNEQCKPVLKAMAQTEQEKWIICENCNEHTTGRCSKCKAGLCLGCNITLNVQDDPSGKSKDNGLCWKCREIKAGTYIGE